LSLFAVVNYTLYSHGTFPQVEQVLWEWFSYSWSMLYQIFCYLLFYLNTLNFRKWKGAWNSKTTGKCAINLN